MSRKYLGIFLMSVLVCNQAFAWRGDGRRPAGDPKILVDLNNSKMTKVGDDVIINISVSNVNGIKDLVCDEMSSIEGVRGNEEITFHHYHDKRLVRAGRYFTAPLYISMSDTGPDYIWHKETLKYNLVCLEMEAGDDMNAIPAPSTFCSPEYENCDWTCNVGSSPDSCESPDPGTTW